HGRGRDGHRVRALRHEVEEAPEVLVQHRVPRDLARVARQALARRQLAVEQQPRDLEEGALLRQLLDRIAAVSKDALFAADEADRRAARARVAVARVGGDQPGVLAQARDVDRALALAALDHGQRVALAVELQRGRARRGAGVRGRALAFLFDTGL